ncbi:src kinase-associated phosphoprotein 1 isoform X1 [Callorhinchus milii]|uniref:Src kinase-associated phosphoprotein 1 n=1 Tax=Callorhinchus milii TaxID=7868 RepID=A0A4W3K175_CALMI|nr:src kinase-associated phosphoprotein 1 isoform X1 [Callorhinchus milii]|eukprot:gi/632972261/ref/XP_007902570.1/ PREDICTED: src kinase-associated phosphoprotein 1 isoform X1 [Callorhinchus milii]
MTLPEEIRRLLEDSEIFIAEILQNEKLSKKTKDKREVLLEGFRLIKYRYQQEFQFRGESGDSYSGSRYEDSSDDSQSLGHAPSGPSDSASLASDNQDDVQYEDIPLLPVQELPNIMKQGYLEKKRRDHSFFVSEWQKRFCVLSTNTFYYYGTEKDKQQRGAFYISNAYLMQNARKDSKKNCCFELVGSDKRTYQFTAVSHVEAKEWVDYILFVLKDMNSNFIPLEEEEEEEEEEEGNDEETYDDVDSGLANQPNHKSSMAGMDQEEEEDIYEVLPDEDFPPPMFPEDEDEEGNPISNYANYYRGLWDCASEGSDELSFQRGDMIHILSKEYNSYGWWVGELKGVVGIVPKDYLMEAYEL